MAESESEYNESEHNSSECDDENWEEEEEEEFKGKPLLWLVQEGLMPEACQRFENLHSSSSPSSSNKDGISLNKQIFQVSREDGNYPLHEILMGGTQDSNARKLALMILDYGHAKTIKPTTFCAKDFIKMLSCQPKSHKRTCLHWAAWSNSELIILQRLVWGYPEALLIPDAKDKGGRTPLEIYKRYHGSNKEQGGGGGGGEKKE
eukprot:1465564-Ditylum_brightwellii.AAC.1